MAASSSRQKGQIPALCQICEESSQIKWKCIDCNFLLCKNCKIIHQKLTYAHDIVDIKEIAVYQGKPSVGLDFGHIKCKIHSGQVCCLYCRDCEQVVCQLCVSISITHNKHKITDISEGYKMSLKTIKTSSSELEQELVKLGTDLSIVENIRSSEKSMYEDRRKGILQQDHILKEMINKYTTQFLGKIEQEWITFHQSTSDKESSVKHVTMETESKIQKITEATNSNKAIEVFEAVEESKKWSKSQDIKPISKKMPEFVPIKITLPTIKSIFGNLQYRKEDIQFKVEEKYTTRLPLVENMVCSTDGSVWISYYLSNLLQNVNLAHKAVTINNDINYQVFNLTLTRSGKLLVSTLKPSLYVLDTKTKTFKTSQYNVSPLQTTGVHATRNNTILVGARDSGPPFPVKGPRQVILLNDEGKQMKVYEFDDYGKKLFTLPRKIITDSNDNIYVSDAVSEDLSGRIVILQKLGGFKIYKGTPEINTYDPFVPNNLTITQLDNVIAADEPNNTLHVINNEGHCIKYINTKLLNIEMPFSLDIDTRGKLHIGCSMHASESEEAKIYVVKFAGC